MVSAEVRPQVVQAVTEEVVDPPETNAKAPYGENDTALAGAVREIFFNESCVEKTYRLEPAAMKAFRLSGEKSAAVAPTIGSVVPVPPAVSNTITCVGGGGALLPGTGTAFGSAPERINFFPSGDTARTLPVTDLNWATVGGVATVTAINPRLPKKEKSVPR